MNRELQARAKAISNLDQTLKEVLIIRNNMAKDVGDGNSMLVFKEVTRAEYDLSGQNPLVKFRAAIREMKKAVDEDIAVGAREGEPLESTEVGFVDKETTAPLSSVKGFTVKQVKKELQLLCDEMGIPTGKRGVFKPFIPGFTQAKTRSDLQYRIGNASNLLSSQGAL
jgi:hypothetical protein